MFDLEDLLPDLDLNIESPSFMVWGVNAQTKGHFLWSDNNSIDEAKESARKCLLSGNVRFVYIEKDIDEAVACFKLVNGIVIETKTLW